MVLKETLSYYVNHGSSVFCVFLDVTKAFDRVQYCSLFDKLLERNVDPLFLRIMVNIYRPTGQLVKVLWNGVYSQNFPVVNGVKQGGIRSPVLFCIYIDDLLLTLRQTGVGCFWVAGLWVH